MFTYRFVKRTVLALLLGAVCFIWGYLFLGSKLSSWFSRSATRKETGSSQAGPPAPVREKIAALRKRIQDNPKDASAYSELADMYFQANRFPQSLELYKKSVELNPRDAMLRNNLAVCYHMLHKDTEAFRQLAVALQAAPRSQHLWLTLGAIQDNAGKTAEARQSLRKAVRLDPKSETGIQAKKLLNNLK